MSELAQVLQKLESLEETMEEGFVAVDRRFDQVDKRLDQVDVRFSSLAKEMDEVKEMAIQTKETLDSLQIATEKDALAIMNHEPRIVRLEQINGIASETPAHLRSFED